VKRRQFIAGLGSAAAWPLVARAQQRSMPVIGFVNAGSEDALSRSLPAFRKGLNETGYVEGENVTVEYQWLAGQYARLPALLDDLVRRRVAVIAAVTAPVALAAKAATATIPIVFGVGEDPVPLGLVASLARPGGNATGVNFFVQEVVAKRLGLLHELVPKAVRVALLVNPAQATTAETTSRDVQEAARAIGLQIQILNASSSNEIDAAFATLARERPDALFVAPDGFFGGRRVQIATLEARDRIPAAYATRDYVAAGGLMSYGTDLVVGHRRRGDPVAARVRSQDEKSPTLSRCCDACARGGDACTATIRISTMNICAKWRGPFRAASMRSASSKVPRDEPSPFDHSITSSARSRIDCGTARPRALAVLRLTTISNLVGTSTGSSVGFAPRRMRST